MKPYVILELKKTLAHIEVEYDLGDTVYHTASDDGARGIVTGYQIRPGGASYLVTWGNTRGEAIHFACELTIEKSL